MPDMPAVLTTVALAAETRLRKRLRSIAPGLNGMSGERSRIGSVEMTNQVPAECLFEGAVKNGVKLPYPRNERAAPLVRGADHVGRAPPFLCVRYVRCLDAARSAILVEGRRSHMSLRAAERMARYSSRSWTPLAQSARARYSMEREQR